MAVISAFVNRVSASHLGYSTDAESDSHFDHQTMSHKFRGLEFYGTVRVLYRVCRQNGGGCIFAFQFAVILG